MDQERFAEAVRQAAQELHQPPAGVISDEVMEAAVVRAAELLEEMAPPAAAALITRGIQIDEAVQQDEELAEMAQFQMLGAALFHCVEVLEMIRQASQQIPEEHFPQAG